MLVKEEIRDRVTLDSFTGWTGPKEERSIGQVSVFLGSFIWTNEGK